MEKYLGYVAIIVALWPLWAKIWDGVKTYLKGSAAKTATTFDDSVLEKMGQAEALKARIMENEFLTSSVPDIYSEIERQYLAGLLPVKGIGKMIELINSVKSVFKAKTGQELSPGGVAQAEKLAESMNKVQKQLSNPQSTPALSS
jgi:hypothetical protein